LKILVLALSGIGDAVMFTPALAKLKKHFNDAQIDALVMFKGTRDIYSRLPYISNIHYYDFVNSNPFAALSYILKHRKQYDISINVYPSNRREYNLINFFVGAPKRAAIKYLHKDFINLGFLNNVTISENDTLHNVEENVRLIEKLTGEEIKDIPPLYLSLNDEEESFARNYLKQIGISGKDLVIGFHPGCAVFKNHINRRWAPGKFVELGKKLISENNAKILLFGGEDEEKLKSEIVNEIRHENAIAVKTGNLLQSIGVMKRCNIFTTNDSALMHIASALKLNVVAIIGPTNINFIRPWKTEHRIAALNLECAPCFYYSPKPLTCTRSDIKYKCIVELGVDLVYSKVKEFLV